MPATLALAYMSTAACAQVSPAWRGGAAPPLADTSSVVVSPTFPPFARAPLDTPLVLTGSFGDRRGGHFHAGLDLSTGGVVGKPVYAPAEGSVARVRASGVGYGRSLYLQMDDGRLVVYGHLDAFAEPLASYVDSMQRSTASYEQDLWPIAGRFRVTTGEIVAWSGESGAGPPHLHAEIRIVDMAHHPLRAGWPLADASPPRIERIVLVPANDGARIAGAAAPHEWSGVQGDTVVVAGRFEVRVEAADVLSSRRDLAPWSTMARLGDRAIECRFDSVSWAGDMSDAAYIYDGSAIRLTAPERDLPRVLSAESFGGPGVRAGEFHMAPGDPPAELEITVRDVAGNGVTRRLWVRSPRATDREVVPPDASTAASAPGVRFELRPAGNGCVQVVLRDVPRETRRAWMGFEGESLAPAGRAGNTWSALVCPRGTGPSTLSVIGVAHAPWRAAHSLNFEHAGLSAGAGRAVSTVFRWSHGEASVFESGALAISHEPAHATGDLVPVSDVHTLEPEAFPLRTAWTVSLAAHPGADSSRVGIYRRGSRAWEWAGADREPPTGTWSASTRRLGSFALFRDVHAPRIHVLRPNARGGGPYSRWAFEARIDEQGSGVDPERSRFMVDGVAVPTEWDPEAGRLRWRPLSPPARGPHTVRVRAVDRVGNTREADGRFVVD